MMEDSIENKKEMFVIDILKQQNNAYVKVIEAEQLYNIHSIHKAFAITKQITDQDFYFVKAIPLYVAILIDMNKLGDLYYLAHKLVSSNPTLAVSWFAVGSYYYSVGKFDLARKYFEKANKIDKHFVASWIAFGHSFAALDESE